LIQLLWRLLLLTLLLPLLIQLLLQLLTLPLLLLQHQLLTKRDAELPQLFKTIKTLLRRGFFVIYRHVSYTMLVDYYI
jgi:hypothetical protein